MYDYTNDTIDDLQAKPDKANALLYTLCSGLDADNVPMPPELLDWWIGYKKDTEPRIQLVR